MGPTALSAGCPSLPTIRGAQPILYERVTTSCELTFFVKGVGILLKLIVGSEHLPLCNTPYSAACRRNTRAMRADYLMYILFMSVRQVLRLGALFASTPN